MLPIWIVRSFVERRRLWHDPRRRQCTLASLTSFTYQGDRIVSVGYSEPARDLVPAHLLAGAKPVKAPQEVFWGGYSGYFADPDGFLWEVAYNPFTDLS